MIGVALPGIPTTPFLLLMCYFLLRVSPSLHAKVMAWPVVGSPLRDWQDHGGVRPQVKFLACTMVVIAVGSTLIWASIPLTLKTAILCAAIYGISVVIRLPTATPAASGQRKGGRCHRYVKPSGDDWQATAGQYGSANREFSNWKV